MPRDAHLSIRVTPEEKAALQLLADSQEVTLGQLARRYLRLRDEQATSIPTVVTRSPQVGRGREREIAWLQANLARLQREMPGQWVIVEGDRLIAHGHDYPAVYRKAREQGIGLPFVERVADQTGAVSMGL